MRILFMGTPDFAVASLKRLVEDGHDVCGVFTQPDKPKNRGHKMAFSPVKEYALTVGLPVSQPMKMRDGEALGIVRELAPELIVVAAYGRILPEDILSTPTYGSINVHSSVLPKYRGAAPIRPRDLAVFPGNAETALQTGLLTLSADDLRIHQLDELILLVQHHAHPAQHTYLRCGQPHAAGIGQRVRQIVQQRVQTSVEVRHRTAYLGQTGLSL